MTNERKPSKALIAIVLNLLLFGGACIYAEWAAWRHVQQSRQEDFEYWRSRLFPLYEASAVEYNRDPKSMEELLDPLFKRASPVR